MGDLPSYGVIIRIVFDPQYRNPQEAANQEPSAAFICEKVHLVNRLLGMGSNGLRSPWMEATSFDLSGLRGSPSSDGTTIETDRLSIDVSVPGIKTEKLWVASWNDCKHLASSKLIRGTDLARIAWRGGQETGKEHCPAIPGMQGHPSIVSRARALAAQMVFGQFSREAAREEMQGHQQDDMNLDDEVLDEGHGNYGQGLTISTIMAASAVDTFETGEFDHIPYPLRTIQQRSGNQVHTVFLSSGAIYTRPVPSEQNQTGIQGRLSVRCEKFRPYENAEYNKHRAFGLNLSDQMPLPPLDFPPPALLPLIRDLNGADFPLTSQPAASSSPAFERFLDQGTDFELNVLRMEPCPPYRPWPHLSQPQPSGLRFFPIQSPPLQPVRCCAKRKSMGEDTSYIHPVKISPQLDPGSFEFDWDCLQGLYGMTYGPWGLEVIYLRSRLLTVHDFEPYNTALGEGEEMPRSTGPHGPGHTLRQASRSLRETLHWKPEPYIDVRDLQMDSQETEFIKPGCRIIEGVKCSGDANVPRGTISFRAYSRGQHQDDCLSYYPTDSRWANFQPWDGKGVDQQGNSNTSRINHSLQQTPGRILDCATGRLAMEGFVNAGCWKRCSVKITSADEVQVYWEALRKVAVCKRLTAC